jgi:anti-anti-sigma regulatory factor
VSHPQLVFRAAGADVLVAPVECASIAVPGLIQEISERCLGPEPPLLVVDLSEVVGWDMQVLAPLVWARRQCLAAGGDLALVLPRRAVFACSEVAVLEQLFVVATDVHRARTLLAGPSLPAPSRARD